MCIEYIHVLKYSTKSMNEAVFSSLQHITNALMLLRGFIHRSTNAAEIKLSDNRRFLRGINLQTDFPRGFEGHQFLSASSITLEASSLPR
jgi:hypothetical protein